ncbi:hypothetical protein AB0J74_00470 [Asanoa sp. NPDC049573]|uniref:hypothetical protein n=1 Tax=Asanoa sp. NPDC049573 TaxID=3155396 RepID=UPI00342FC66F
MTTGAWKGHINGILYGIQFDPVLDDTVVARVADGVVGGMYPGDREVTLDAVNEALRSPGALNDVMETPHSEESIRDFLGKLSAALAARA